MERTLGIDYGAKRIGLALSDEGGKVAFPKETVRNDKNALDYVADYVTTHNVVTIVIGDSRDNNGTQNKIARRAKIFGAALAHATAARVVYEQEFFSSVEADRALFNAGVKRQENIDAHAAAVILQRYLDKMHYKT